MRHFMIDLGDTVKTLLIQDEYILEIRELNYTGTLTDLLYEQIVGYSIDKMTIITHNRVSYCLYQNSYVAFQAPNQNEVMLSSVSAETINVIAEIANRCCISDVKFIDSLGLFYENAEKGKCYLDTCHGTYSLYAFIDGNVEFKTMLNLDEKQIHEFCDEFKLDNSFITYGELADFDNLMLFYNAAMIMDNENIMRDLALFANALLLRDSTDDKFYLYDLNIMNNTVEKITAYTDNAEVDDVLEIDDLTEKIENEVSSGKKSFFKKNKLDLVESSSDSTQSTVKQNTKGELIINLLLIVGALSIVLTAVIFILGQITSTKLNTLHTQIQAKNTEYEKLSSTVSTYDYCLQSGGGNSLELLNNLASYANIYSAKFDMYYVDDTTSFVTYDFDTEKHMHDFIENIHADFPAATIDEKKNENTYTITVNIQK